MRDVRLIFRPLTVWPGSLRTDAQREHALWDSTYTATKQLLTDEAERHHAREVVVHLALPESRILKSGDDLKASARPEHPGVLVVVNIGAEKPPLSLHCDLYKARTWKRTEGWHDNLRAIAKSLEAMRALDRWGATQGRQYAGFRELGSGIAMGAGAQPQMSVDDAARFIGRHGGFGRRAALPEPFTKVLLQSPQALAAAYRIAARKLHPDAGGDPETCSASSRRPSSSSRTTPLPPDRRPPMPDVPCAPAHLGSLIAAVRDQWAAHRQIFGPLDHDELCCAPCAVLDELGLAP